MREQVPLPEGVTGAQFLRVIESLKTLKKGTRRHILFALAQGEKRGVWVKIEGLRRQNKARMILRLRQSGWMIDKTTPSLERTWRWIRTADVTVPRVTLRKVWRHTAPSQYAAFRLNPTFMLAFRRFLANYRRSGGVIVNRWEKKHIARPFGKILKALRIDAGNTRA